MLPVFGGQGRERRLEQTFTPIPGFGSIQHPYFPWYWHHKVRTLRWSLRPICLLLMDLSCQGHLVEKAPTILTLLSVLYFPLYKYVFSYLLGNLSYSLYLCRFIIFQIPFPPILRETWGGEGGIIKIIYAICHIEPEVPEIQF